MLMINFDIHETNLRFFSNQSDAKPIIPNAKIASVDGSGTAVGADRYKNSLPLLITLSE
jgi:hypothetical protein